MPRAAKESDGEILQDTSPVNGINTEQLKGFVAEYEAEIAAMDDIMAGAIKLCQPHKDHMKEIAKEAAEAAIPKKVFKAKIAERRFLRKAEAADSALSDEMKEIYAEVSLKLGPLGEWAKANANGLA